MNIKEVNPNFIFSVNKKLFYVFMLIIIFVIFFLILSFVKSFRDINIIKSVESCGDGTFKGTCSLNKPYYCGENLVLVSNSSVCGCPQTSSKTNGGCFFDYEFGEKIIPLRFILNGEENFINFKAYKNVNDYLSNIPQSIRYYGGEISSRSDFKINKIDESLQRDFLIPLVVEIQNLAPNSKDDQARIAISIVQNIPYAESNKKSIFGSQEIIYSRYPYQVLYDNAGICGEKTELLAFLLREIGYGTSFFYYPEENHEALGIKCALPDSFLNTGYCFIETTAPSIISDSNINYVDLGRLNSEPNLFFISEGLTFGEDNFYEIRDAHKLMKIRNFVERHGWIGLLRKNSYDKLKKRYGLVEEYYGS